MMAYQYVVDITVDGVDGADVVDVVILDWLTKAEDLFRSLGGGSSRRFDLRKAQRTWREC
jgi:hypothetical protein